MLMLIVYRKSRLLLRVKCEVSKPNYTSMSLMTILDAQIMLYWLTVD